LVSSPVPASRAAAACRAACTRRATATVGSGASIPSSQAALVTGGRATRRSMRSSSGPDIRDW
jgi:hypothetical protein